MMDKHLSKIVRDFTKGILGGRSCHSMCFIVTAPLVSYLQLAGFNATLIEGLVDGNHHYWIRIEDDGTVVDPTAGQFRKPKLFGGGRMPNIYIGPKLAWYEEEST